MKKVITLTNFAKGGLNTDLPAHLLGDAYITEGNNFRCINNSIQNTPAAIPVPGAGALNMDTGRLYHIRNNEQNYFVSCGTGVYVWDGEKWTSLDLPSPAIEPLLWTAAKLGNKLLLANYNSGVWYWPRLSLTTKLKAMPWNVGHEVDGVVVGQTWAEANQGCKIIRSHKSYGIAMDLILPDGTTLPNGVRWSDPSDNNDIPYTWDEADPANLAGLNILADEGGAISDGLSLRDNFVIYRENAIWNMNHVGGRWVWKFTKQSFNIGALSNGCVAEVNGAHVVFGDGDIVLYDGNAVKSIVNNRIRKRINSTISVDNFKNSYVVQNKEKKEVWFCFNENGHDTPEPNKAYIWNWEEDTWGLQDIGDTESGLSHIAFGNITASPTNDLDNWDSNDIAWNADDRPWNSADYIPFENTLVGTKPDGTLYNMTPIQQSNVPVNIVIERTNIPIETQEKFVSIDRLFPNITGKGIVQLQVGSQEFYDAPVKWKPKVDFEIGQDRKIDTRATGALMAVRLTADTAAPFKFSGVDMEYTVAGTR